MSAAKNNKAFEQPESFRFTPENLQKIQAIIAKYPKGRQQSAVMALLELAQRQHDNWIPEAAMEEIARILEIPRIKVFEVATFYTMYNLAPVGRHHLQFCTTTPCWLRGSADLVAACEKHLGIKMGETTDDGEFTMTEVECIGACVNAPVIQHNGDDYYEDLTPQDVIGLLEDLKAGRKPRAGSHAGRQGSCPVSGATTLKEAK